jgi:hypothetical protein
MKLIRLLSFVGPLACVAALAGGLALAQSPPPSIPAAPANSVTPPVAAPVINVTPAPVVPELSGLEFLQPSKIIAGEAYAEPTSRELVQAFVMMDGVNIKSSEFLDAYAKVFYCDLYRQKYTKDFEWNAVREQITGRLRAKKDSYRSLYEISGVTYLGRYNFDTQDFPLDEKSALFNVASLVVADRDSLRASGGKCDDPAKGYFPGLYTLRLKQPFTFERLKIPVEEAEKLLEKMDKTKNTERKLYVRFRMRVQSLLQEGNQQLKDVPPPHNLIFLGDLIAVDVFFDREMTRFVASIPVD